MSAPVSISVSPKEGSPADQLPSSYSFGVSNNDLDWVFRPKSKKSRNRSNTAPPRPTSAPTPAATAAAPPPAPPSSAPSGSTDSGTPQTSNHTNQPTQPTQPTQTIRKNTNTPPVPAEIAAATTGTPKSPNRDALAPIVVPKQPAAAPPASPAASKEPKKSSWLSAFSSKKKSASSPVAVPNTQSSAPPFNTPPSEAARSPRSPVAAPPISATPPKSPGGGSAVPANPEATPEKSSGFFGSLRRSKPVSASSATTSTTSMLSAMLKSQMATSEGAMLLSDEPPKHPTGSAAVTDFGLTRIPSNASGSSFGSTIAEPSELFASPVMVLNRNKTRQALPSAQLNSVATQLKRVAFRLDTLETDPAQQIPSRTPRQGFTEPQPQSQNSEKPQRAPASASASVSVSATPSGPASAPASNPSLAASSAPTATPPDLANFQPAAPPPREPFDASVPLETVYTRCCHLREILPIPVTLRQIEGKQAPLPLLRMINPKPTMVDVLAFSDFVAITPIQCLVFDSVFLTDEMSRVLFAAVITAPELEKLSLKNCPLSASAWSYLCTSLARNRTISRLDLSQTKVKPEWRQNYLRADRDWNLLADAIQIRKGIPELFLNGCRIPSDAFADFIKRGCKQYTRRLGLASNQLGKPEYKIIAKAVTSSSSANEGLDVGFNAPMADSYFEPFIRYFTPNWNLKYLSFNACDISPGDKLTEFLTLLSTIPLRFLDLSANPKLFPAIVPTLRTLLPRFPDLRRLHLDSNNLTSKDVISMAEVLPKMKNLVHISFLDNSGMDVTAIGALYTAVKASRTIITMEIDEEHVPEKFTKSIAFYCMRNMQWLVNKDVPGVEASREDEFFLSQNFENRADDLMKAGSLVLKSLEGFFDHKGSDYEYREITESLINTTLTIRSKIHQAMDVLFDKRANAGLSKEQKEDLVRFCFLDNAIDRILEAFEPVNHENSSDVPPASLETTQLPSPPARPTISRHSSTDDERYLTATSNMFFEPHDASLPVPELASDSDLQPHTVREDRSGDLLDASTGRIVLTRRPSSTMLEAKKQEIEEGELHRWGTFVMKKQSKSDGSIDFATKSLVAQKVIQERQSSESVPIVKKTDRLTSPQDGSTSDRVDSSKETSPLPETSSAASSVPSTPIPASFLPSGDELRKAVLKAKGVKSINNLLTNLNAPEDEEAGPPSPTREDADKVVDEAYEKILDEYVRAPPRK